jgi:hypothetical protein
MEAARTTVLYARPAAALVITGLSALGCGGSPPPAASLPSSSARGDHEEAPQGPSTESEIGGLDESRVKQTFERSASKLSTCFNQGTQRIPYLSGEVRFVVRVKKDGSPRWAFVNESTLGDRTAEDCMLSVLRGLSFPKPQGGEGIAENSFTFEPSADTRAPLTWSPEQLGAPFRKAQPTLSKCRTGAGAGALKATIYIDTDGKPIAIGASSADHRGEAAIGCVVSTLKGITFPSPGSYASKVSVTID